MTASGGNQSAGLQPGREIPGPGGPHRAGVGRTARILCSLRSGAIRTGPCSCVQPKRKSSDHRVRRQLVRVFAVENSANRDAPLYDPVVHVTPESAPALVEHDRVLVTVSGGFRAQSLGHGHRKASCETDQHQGLKPARSRGLARWQVVCGAGYNGPELYTADGKEPRCTWATRTWSPVRLQPRQHDAALRELGSDRPALVGSGRAAARSAACAHGERQRAWSDDGGTS